MAYKFQIGAATMSGALEQQGTLQANDAAIFQSRVDITGAVEMNSTLDVAGIISGASNLDIGGNADIDGTLEVDGKATFLGRVDITGGVEMVSTLFVNSDTTLDANVTLGNSASDVVEFKADVSSSIIPVAANEHDIGAAGDEWRAGYFEDIFANTDISGAQLQGPLEYSASADAQGGIQAFTFTNSDVDGHASVALKN